MLLDDLLNDEPAMRGLVALFLRRSRPTVDAQPHESFLDHAALHDEIFARSLGMRAMPAERKRDGQYARRVISAPLVEALVSVTEVQMPSESELHRLRQRLGKAKKPARRVSRFPPPASSPIKKPPAATETHIESPASARALTKGETAAVPPSVGSNRTGTSNSQS